MNKIMLRFASFIELDEDTGCWIWKGGTTTGGYGKFWVKKQQYRAHRYSHELFIGPIPDGLCILHECDTPACVHPWHGFPGTNKENTADMIAKGRSTIGHPQSEEAKRKIGLAHTGMKFSGASKAKMSASAKARKRKPHSTETRAKLSLATLAFNLKGSKS